MSQEEIDRQIGRLIRERRAAVAQLASVNLSLTENGRLLSAIGASLDGAQPGRLNADLLDRQLRELEIDKVREAIRESLKLARDVAEMTAYLRNAGVPISD
jgi:hypothetical protein